MLVWFLLGFGFGWFLFVFVVDVFCCLFVCFLGFFLMLVNYRSLGLKINFFRCDRQFQWTQILAGSVNCSGNRIHVEPTRNLDITPSAFPMKEELKGPDILGRAGAQRAGSRQQILLSFFHHSHFPLCSEGAGLSRGGNSRVFQGWDFQGFPGVGFPRCE